MNKLHYGDNLQVLRDQIPDESIDLIYLDPPFNSQQAYNVIFHSPKGQQSEAQITAFEDTWYWSGQAEYEYNEILRSPNSDAAEMVTALRRFLGEINLMAYLTMMTNRLIELHRVLKQTGSLYLHCDPTASHYLKIVLDSVFDKNNFRSEIIWRRTGAHGKAKRYGPIHDTIFFYTKSDSFTWNYLRTPYMRGHVEENFIQDELGYKTNYYGNVLTGSGIRHGQSGKPWRGFDPTAKNRHWAIPGRLVEDAGEDMSELSPHQKLDRLYELGYIKIEEGSAWPIYEHRITEKDGLAISDLWTFQPYTKGTVFGTEDGIDEDVRWLHPRDRERLGYPTQKPLGLLERITRASSIEGDTILDPFCGCGTTVHAAEKLGRKWIGIDITHLAITLIEKRLRDAFPDIEFEVEGTPKDLAGARDLAKRDKYQFQWWALWLINAQPYKGKRKGADKGIDGLIFFTDIIKDKPITKKIVVSVKGGENVGVTMIRELITVAEQNDAEMGFFITLAEPTKPMTTEAAAAGFYTAANGIDYPRIQILTIEGLLSGHQRPEYIDYRQGEDTFKKAQTEKKQTQQTSYFDNPS